MKTLLKLITLLFLFLILALFVGVQFAPGIVTNFVESRTGYDIELEDKKINLLSGIINLKSLVIENSDDFPVEEFLTLNELGLHVKPSSLLSDRAVIEEFVLDVGRVVWVKNAEGVDNLNLFASRLQGEKEAEADEEEPVEEEPKDDKPAKQKEFLAKTITIRIGSLARMDYSGSGKPLIQDFEVGYDRTFTDVTDISQVTTAVSKDLMGLGFKFLADSLLKSALNPGTYIDMGGKILEGAGSGAEAVGEAVGSGAEGVKDAVKGLFDKF